MLANEHDRALEERALQLAAIQEELAFQECFCLRHKALQLCRKLACKAIWIKIGPCQNVFRIPNGGLLLHSGNTKVANARPMLHIRCPLIELDADFRIDALEGRQITLTCFTPFVCFARAKLAVNMVGLD